MILKQRKLCNGTDGEGDARARWIEVPSRMATSKTRWEARLDREELMQLARWLLHTPAAPAKPVRLLGLTASNFARASLATAPVQLTLGIADLAPSALASDVLEGR